MSDIADCLRACRPLRTAAVSDYAFAVKLDVLAGNMFLECDFFDFMTSPFSCHDMTEKGNDLLKDASRFMDSADEYTRQAQKCEMRCYSDK